MVTGKLLLGLGSAGFGASLGFAVKQWLERRDRVGQASDE
jgi:hypothetical protein